MTRQEALRALEETLEMGPNTLTGDEALKDLKNWDSLSTLMFIAMVDKKFGLPLPGGRVARCQTVSELIALLGNTAAGKAA